MTAFADAPYWNDYDGDGQLTESDVDAMTYVGKSIGEHTIDLRIETIVKDNILLLDLLEKIKGMDGVNDVVWSEIVSVVGRKISIPSSIIDKI